MTSKGRRLDNVGKVLPGAKEKALRLGGLVDLNGFAASLIQHSGQHLKLHG